MNETKIKLAIVGKGNVGTHLAKAFAPHVEVTLVNSRNLEELPDFSDIILLCVKDDAIAQLASRLKGKASVIAHTSGSVPMSVLNTCGDGIGVFYPLQTFTKDISMDYSTLPIFIEGNTPEVETELSRVARLFTSSVTAADSEVRKKLHLAAVFACNFTNALCTIADNILSTTGLNIKSLLPLLSQTVEKLNRISPHDAQTGPAVRNDIKVIEAHLKMLDSHPECKEIYSLLSRYIIKHNFKE